MPFRVRAEWPTQLCIPALLVGKYGHGVGANSIAVFCALAWKAEHPEYHLPIHNLIKGNRHTYEEFFALTAPLRARRNEE